MSQKITWYFAQQIREVAPEEWGATVAADG